MLQYVSAIWAPSSMEQRRALWERFCVYRKTTMPDTTLDHAAAAFISTIPNVLLQTKKTYAVALSSMLRELVIPYPTLALVRKGMVAMGADIADDKAIPINRDQAMRLVEIHRVLEPQLSLCFWLMWKTASRFSDLQDLRRNNFLLISPQEIILRFGKLKNNQAGTVKQSSLLQILDDQPMEWQAQLLQALPPERPLVPLTYTTFLAKIKKTFPDLSAHSFKHGAHQFMMEQVDAGKLDMQLVPLLMKHSDTTSRYPEQTLNYARDETLMLYARQFRTGNATRLL